MTAGPRTAPVNQAVYERAVERFRDRRIVMPTFAQLADPSLIPDAVEARLAAVDADAPDPLNLFRVHWFNGADRRTRVAVPQHMVLPTSLTGVAAPIIIALGDRFPMIAAHKVLAAYSCLAPRIVMGQFDPIEQRAVWPSTGNYCRGGVAISRIMGCRGVAVLPEGMSRERFDWLDAGSPTRPTSFGPTAPRATSRRSTTSARSSRLTPPTSSSTSSPSSETILATTW